MNFQLYRGNLHKVPDVPRRWPLSKPSISLQVFKKAIAKRREALLAEQKLRGEQGDAYVQEDLQAGDKDDHEHGRKRKREHAETSGMDMEAKEDLHWDSERKGRTCDKADLAMIEEKAVDGADGMACEPSCALRSTFDTPSRAQGEDTDMTGNEMENNVTPGDSITEKEGERLEAPRTPAAKDEDCSKSIERNQTADDGATPCNEVLVPSLAKKRVELQEQLKQLQETKHQLVQILKQVLITEEESKRKSQGLLQYSAPYAMAGTADLPLDQKIGSYLQSGDLEEGELDYTRNPGPPVVVSSYGSHFVDAHPQTLGAAPARHLNHQQLNKQ